MVGLLGGNDGCVRAQREGDTWVWDQIGLERGHVDVNLTIETERGRNGGDNLGDETVQVGVGWSLNVEVATADVVEGLVVNHEGNIRVLKHTVRRQSRIVRLDDGGGALWGRVDREEDLSLAAVVNGETLEEQGGETTTRTTTKGVEDHETLETSALVGLFTKSVENKVDDFFANGVVTTGVVIGGIFLSGDELLWVEQLAVRASADLVNDGWFQIQEDCTWDVFARACLGKECSVRVVVGVVIITIANGGFLAVWLNTVLEAEKFPASITELDTGLADVDG